MNLHKEVHFETAICEHLGAHGWRYAEGDAAHFDSAHGLYLPDLLAWIEAYAARELGAAFQESRSDRGRAHCRARAQEPQRTRHAGCAASRRGDAGAEAAAVAGAVQAGAGDECGPADTLRSQPPARGAAGASFAEPSHRRAGPGAVPQRHRRGHGRAEVRFHAERRRCGGPVPLRPPSASQGRVDRAAAELSRAVRWCISPSARPRS